MPSFLSKVFGRKKDEKSSSQSLGRGYDGSLLGGKFEAVSPAVSPSATEFPENVPRGNGKEKEKEAKGLFKVKSRSRPSSPELLHRKDDLPQLSLVLPVPQEDARARALGVVFEADPEAQILTDVAIGNKRLSPSEALILVRTCSEAIITRGLETLGLMHPHWYSASPDVQHRLISLFIHSLNLKTPITTLSPSSSSSSIFETEINYTLSPHDVAAVLRWGLRHLELDGDSFGKEESWYKAFAEAERSSEFPPKAYSEKFVPLVPPAHLELLNVTLDLFSSLAAHAEKNSTSGSKLSRAFGLWLLAAQRVEENDDWPKFYARWEQTGRIMEHLFLSRIRDEASSHKDEPFGVRMPARLTELVAQYPYAKGTTLDDDVFLCPHLSTRQFNALFVRVETEFSTPEDKVQRHPLRFLKDTFALDATTDGSDHSAIWEKIRKSGNDENEVSPGGYPGLSRVFADETIRYLTLVPGEHPMKRVTSPSFSLIDVSQEIPTSRRYASSPEETSSTPANGSSNGHAKPATDPTPLPSAISSPTDTDWTHFSSSGFSDASSSFSPLASTLFGQDVEKTNPPFRKSTKRSKVSPPSRSPTRKSVDVALPRASNVSNVTPQPETPKLLSKSIPVSLVQIDEAFIEFWIDALLDPISSTWPTFVLGKLKTSLPDLNVGDKCVEYLVIEHIYVYKPSSATPTPTPTPTPAPGPASAQADVAEPATPPERSATASPKSSIKSEKRFFGFFTSSRGSSPGGEKLFGSTSKGKKKVSPQARVSELGEVLKEEDEKPSTTAATTVKLRIPSPKPRKSVDVSRRSVDAVAARKSVEVPKVPEKQAEKGKEKEKEGGVGNGATEGTTGVVASIVTGDQPTALSRVQDTPKPIEEVTKAAEEPQPAIIQTGEKVVEPEVVAATISAPEVEERAAPADETPAGNGHTLIAAVEKPEEEATSADVATLTEPVHPAVLVAIPTSEPEAHAASSDEATASAALEEPAAQTPAQEEPAAVAVPEEAVQAPIEEVQVEEVVPAVPEEPVQAPATEGSLVNSSVDQEVSEVSAVLEPAVEEPIVEEEHVVVEEPVAIQEQTQETIAVEPVAVEETPVVEEAVAVEERAAEIPVVEEVQVPVVEEAVGERAVPADEPVQESIAVEEPVVIEEAPVKEPVAVEEPVVEQPVRGTAAEAISTEEPAVKEPALVEVEEVDPVEQSITVEEPALEPIQKSIPIVEHTPVEEILIEESIPAERPTAEEPIVESPVVAEPEEPEAPEPIVGDVITQEPQQTIAVEEVPVAEEVSIVEEHAAEEHTPTETIPAESSIVVEEFTPQESVQEPVSTETPVVEEVLAEEPVIISPEAEEVEAPADAESVAEVAVAQEPVVEEPAPVDEAVPAEHVSVEEPPQEPDATEEDAIIEEAVVVEQPAAEVLEPAVKDVEQPVATENPTPAEEPVQEPVVAEDAPVAEEAAAVEQLAPAVEEPTPEPDAVDEPTTNEPAVADETAAVEERGQVEEPAEESASALEELAADVPRGAEESDNVEETFIEEPAAVEETAVVEEAPVVEEAVAEEPVVELASATTAEESTPVQEPATDEEHTIQEADVEKVVVPEPAVEAPLTVVADEESPAVEEPALASAEEHEEHAALAEPDHVPNAEETFAEEPVSPTELATAEEPAPAEESSEVQEPPTADESVAIEPSAPVEEPTVVEEQVLTEDATNAAEEVAPEPASEQEEPSSHEPVIKEPAAAAATATEEQSTPEANTASEVTEQPAPPAETSGTDTNLASEGAATEEPTVVQDLQESVEQPSDPSPEVPAEVETIAEAEEPSPEETTETEAPEEAANVPTTPAADAEPAPADEAVVAETVVSEVENSTPQETPTDDLPSETAPTVPEPIEPSAPATEQAEEPAGETAESEVIPPNVEADLVDNTTPTPHDEEPALPAETVELEAIAPADDTTNLDNATQPPATITEDTPEAPPTNGEATCAPGSEIANGNGHHAPAPEKASIDDEIPTEIQTADIKHDIKPTLVQASSESIPSEPSPETLSTTATDD